MQNDSHTPRSTEIPLLNHVEVRDPVCGMTVDPAHAAGSLEWGGATWYFCSRDCLEKFRSAPEKYTGPETVRTPAPATAAQVARGEDVKYTCPMHPEVVQNGP